MFLYRGPPFPYSNREVWEIEGEDRPMLKKLLALALLVSLVPAAAWALPVKPDPSVVRSLPNEELRFWETEGADAWADRDRALFPDAEDVLTVIAAEQGMAADCFVLSCGGETAMIDCGLLGPDNLVPRMLKLLGIARFDYIINTHPHDDHINGIIELLPLYEIGAIYAGFERHANNLNKRLFREAIKLNIPVEQVGAPLDLRLGAAELRLYQVPWGDNVNNRSLVTRVTLGGRSLLLTADIGQSGIRWLLDTYGADSFQADILKIPHHGIDRVAPELLAAADPQAVFITYFPHSRNELTHKQLVKLGYDPLYAGLGSLVMKTDGRSWTLSQLPKEAK